jgi:septal ring factor EnvC (AmiA/AmiB activator)
MINIKQKEAQYELSRIQIKLDEKENAIDKCIYEKHKLQLQIKGLEQDIEKFVEEYGYLEFDHKVAQKYLLNLKGEEK